MPFSRPRGFSRLSIADQAAGALRQAIRSGEIGDPLPGTHQLAAHFGISRPSISAALALLATEGLVVISKGRRTQLTGGGAHSPPLPPAVCVLCPVASSTPLFVEHPVMLEMHVAFASLGVRWEAVFEPRLYTERPEARLKQLVTNRPHVCWILFSVPERIQQWFAAADVPVLVVGSCLSALKLPSADLNYGAVAWHAAGAMMHHGHRHIALIQPAKPQPGDVATRAEFLRYAERHGAGVTVTDWHAPERIAECGAKLDRLLAGPQPPTALFIMLTIMIMMRLIGSGIRIPREISIVSRDTHDLIDAALPELTRYTSTAIKLASRAVKLAMYLIAGHKIPEKPSLVMPAFVAGSTLAACKHRIA